MEKAYDTVDWPVMRQILWRYGVPDALILVPRKLYLEISIKLKVCGKNVRIPSTVGIWQGDNLASIIFVLFINAVGGFISPKW